MIPLLVLALLVGAVFALGLAFAGYALHVHTRNSRKARRRQALEERWNPLLLAVLAGEEPAPLLANVDDSEALFFVDFLFRYGNRLRGRERKILGEIAAPFLPPLVTRIRGDRNPERRARAVRTIGVLGGPEHIPDLRFALDDPSPLVAMTAARALALRGYPDLVPLFLDRADRFRDWSPRFFASMLAAAGPTARVPLRAMAADPGRSPWSRRVAVDALAELNDLDGAEVATAILAESDDRDLQCACLRLLERVGSAANAATARPLIERTDPMVRLCAISAIGALGGEEDVPVLRSALETSDLWIALNAGRALRKLGDHTFLANFARTGATRARLAAQVLREDRA